MDDLRTLEQRREERPDGPVDPMGPLGATRHVDERQHRVQAEAADRVVGRAAAQLGPEGVACHDDLAGGKVAAAVGERDGDATREAGADPVRQPRRRGLLVDDDRETQRSEEHTSELQSLAYLVCRLLLEKKKRKKRATDK